jgi:hypothetical protein
MFPSLYLIPNNKGRKVSVVGSWLVRTLIKLITKLPPVSNSSVVSSVASSVAVLGLISTGERASKIREMDGKNVEVEKKRPWGIGVHRRVHGLCQIGHS